MNKRIINIILHFYSLMLLLMLIVLLPMMCLPDFMINEVLRVKKTMNKNNEVIKKEYERKHYTLAEY
jgi:ABC-type bacteriocin/lantibiotic exporter with double-glycine peptidase domain